ncbi:hypothetical protein T03_12826 [Trichinella britovi]|uniref:Uncharacterized protein n=1 Tax=Trichinella britovi TaxID=45882 RepID=A0A0V1B4U4_TRIBR|nr:hypothetical protein T03_12826 [Trichinella britovi]
MNSLVLFRTAWRSNFSRSSFITFKTFTRNILHSWRPLPASAVTLSQQPRIGVDISWPDCCTLCATFGPTLANTRQCLGWWRHYLQIHRKSPSPVSDLLARDVLTLQAARDGRLRGGVLSLLLMYWVGFHSQKVYPGLDELKDGDA